VGVEALGVCAYTFFVIFTLWFIYRQVRTAAKAFQLDAICRLQQLVDDFREDRHTLFTTCPLDLAISHEQFARKPPGRRKVKDLADEERRRMVLTEKQAGALRSISNELRERANCVISRLNDIGELVEDVFVDRHVFLGKYHVMIVRCCHLVEAIRRDEETRHGGSYGQRLLRMRHWATTYNDIWPKHRNVAIAVTGPQGRRVLYQSPSSTAIRRVIWAIRRWLLLY